MNDEPRKGQQSSQNRLVSDSVFHELQIPGGVIKSIDDRVLNQALRRADTFLIKMLKSHQPAD